MARPLLTATALFLLAGAAAAGPRYAPGALIVKLREDAGAASLEALRREPDVREVRALFRRGGSRPQTAARRGVARGAQAPDLSRVFRVRLAPEVDPAQAAERYAADSRVEWAQPDLLMQQDVVATEFVPNDPFFLSSGSWGQPYRDLWGLESIRAPEAWQLTRGEGAVIAVIDTGIDTTHPDIVDNLWVNPGEDLDGDGRASDADRNGIDDDDNGFVDDLIGFDFYNSVDANGDGDYADPGDLSDADPTDDGGHGSHVTGTAAAVGGNGIGIIGVAPRARVMSLKGLGAQGSGTSSGVARALVYAAENGADVINASWSCSSRCPVNPLIDEAVAFAHAQGTLMVDSAGNSGDDVVFFSPEKRRETIVVAASREDDSRAPFSSVGFLVDVAAPGAGRLDPAVVGANRAILSLLWSGAPDGGAFRVGDRYSRLSGTSMSTPHVAGVVALMRSLDPDATPEEIRARIRASARDVGAPGHDRLFGAGIVDAFGALTRAAPRVRGEIALPEPGATVDARSGAVELRGSAEGDDFASYALSFGRGLDPSLWQPIASASANAVHDGLLASWNVGGLEVGAYVLRLEVTSGSGERVQEFLPLSLERNLPFAVSPQGSPAFAPDVSGDLVVWEADSGNPASGRDLYARDLRRESVIPVAEAPGDQRAARVSHRRVVFLDREREQLGEIGTCEVDAKRGLCEVTRVAEGPVRRTSHAPSGDRVFWLEDDATGASPRLCDLRHGATSCEARPLAERAVRQFDLEVSDLRLVWRETLPVWSLQTCLLDPRSGACPVQPVHVAPSSSFPSVPAVSGERFTWEVFGPVPSGGVATQAQVCRLDRTSGACPPLRVGVPSGSRPAPDLAGDVVVWNEPVGDGSSAIFFCEHDAVSNTCPAQRLTGAAAGQRNPSISGRRVVFEDERDGPSRIYGIDLPDLALRGSRRVREGELLRIEVTGEDPTRAPVQLAAELPGGLPVESLGMRLAPHGRSRALLLWRPDRNDSGRYTVLLRGTTRGGLVTRERLEIEVLESKRGHGRPPHRD